MATSGPCSWPIIYPEGCAVGPEYYLSPVQRDLYEDMAAALLWRWTGRVFGPCPVVLRPCRVDCLAAGWFRGWSGVLNGQAFAPALVGGRWYNVRCGACGDACSCGDSTPALDLPGPVASVTEVHIDGAVVPAAQYRVDNHSLLVRLSDTTTDPATRRGWPTCQDMDLPPTEPGTWQVSYLRGVEVPEGGQIAAGVLALELARAAQGDSGCQLPRRVQSITRQGVTVAVLDSFEDVDKGRTGIWLIDSWVASINAPVRGGSVRSVDIPHPRHRVKTWPSI